MDFEKKAKNKSLEGKVKNKPNLFAKIKRKLMPCVLAVSLSLASCYIIPSPPESIIVQNRVIPSVVSDGDWANWNVSVTNYGDRVYIERITVHEEAISGWAAGHYEAFFDMPIVQHEICSNSTQTIIDRYISLFNTGIDSITYENTVTVFTDGGDASDTCFYTCTPW
ncbi:MAG: hypothetical protein NTU63_03615 [Candidatus Pacearchaeota archaeon]|nr:hypothetical protein [Candidatus Pacearchaeota archaeon]